MSSLAAWLLIFEQAKAIALAREFTLVLSARSSQGTFEATPACDEEDKSSTSSWGNCWPGSFGVGRCRTVSGM
jgi:hypothetical protein